MRWLWQLLFGEAGLSRPGILVTGGVLASAIVAITVAAGGGSSDTANLWVNTTAGGSPGPRCSTPCAYNADDAYGSFQAARNAASDGDVIGVKSGTYGSQGGVGGSGKSVTFRGESGVLIDGGSAIPNFGVFSFNGGVTLDDIDITAASPVVSFGGTGNTWRDSDYYPYPASIRSYNAYEPLAFEDGCSGHTTASEGCDVSNPTGADYTIINSRIDNVRIGVTQAFKGCKDGDTARGCPNGDNMHLEPIRIGGGADGIIIENSIIGSCPNGNVGGIDYVGCGSGQVFAANCLNPACKPPKNVTFRNNVFMDAGSGISYHVQIHPNMGTGNLNWTWAYNTFDGGAEMIAQASNIAGVRMIGNYGVRPGTCTTGTTFTRNVWAWPSGGTCGTDQRVSALALDSSFIPSIGSAAIGGGETPDASDYCTGDLGSVDGIGVGRPVGSACDAGARERPN